MKFVIAKDQTTQENTYGSAQYYLRSAGGSTDAGRWHWSAYRELLRGTPNTVLQAESAEQLGAERHECTGERSNMRNGTRSRSLTTRIGIIELTVPRHRNVPFKTPAFDNFCRSEGAPITTMAKMVVSGVSAAKVTVPSRFYREFNHTHVSYRHYSFAFYTSTPLSIDTSPRAPAAPLALSDVLEPSGH